MRRLGVYMLSFGLLIGCKTRQKKEAISEPTKEAIDSTQNDTTESRAEEYGLLLQILRLQDLENVGGMVILGEPETVASEEVIGRLIDSYVNDGLEEGLGLFKVASVEATELLVDRLTEQKNLFDNIQTASGVAEIAERIELQQAVVKSSIELRKRLEESGSIGAQSIKVLIRTQKIAEDQIEGDSRALKHLETRKGERLAIFQELENIRKQQDKLNKEILSIRRDLKSWRVKRNKSKLKKLNEDLKVKMAVVNGLNAEIPIKKKLLGELSEDSNSVLLWHSMKQKEAVQKALGSAPRKTLDEVDLDVEDYVVVQVSPNERGKLMGWMIENNYKKSKSFSSTAGGSIDTFILRKVVRP